MNTLIWSHSYDPWSGNAVAPFGDLQSSARQLGVCPYSIRRTRRVGVLFVGVPPDQKLTTEHTKNEVQTRHFDAVDYGVVQVHNATDDRLDFGRGDVLATPSECVARTVAEIHVTVLVHFENVTCADQTKHAPTFSSTVDPTQCGDCSSCPTDKPTTLIKSSQHRKYFQRGTNSMTK